MEPEPVTHGNRSQQGHMQDCLLPALRQPSPFKPFHPAERQPGIARERRSNRRRRPAVQEIAGGAFAAHGLVKQMMGRGQGLNPFRLRAVQHIKGQAVSAHCLAYVFHGFETSLDLEAGHPGGPQFRQQINPAEIIHGEQVPAAFPGPGRRAVALFFLLPAVTAAAGLDALAAQARATAMQAGKHAQSRIAETHGPVHENLEFRPAPARDGPNLLDGQLPGQHHPVKAPGRELVRSQGIVDGHKGTGMQDQGGEKPAGNI